MEPKACINCNKTFWAKQKNELRCEPCFLSLKRKYAQFEKRRKLKEKNARRKRQDDGTVVIFYNRNCARTIGKDFIEPDTSWPPF